MAHQTPGCWRLFLPQKASAAGQQVKRMCSEEPEMTEALRSLGSQGPSLSLLFLEFFEAPEKLFHKLIFSFSGWSRVSSRDKC